MLDHAVKAMLRMFYLITARSVAYTYSVEEHRSSRMQVYSKVVLGFILPDPARRLDKHPLLILALVLYYQIKRSCRQGAARVTNTKLVNYAAANIQPLASYAGVAASVTRASLALLTMYLVLVYIHLSWQLVPFAKVLFSWLAAGAFLYLLVSGFVYFTNKLSYGSNVDVIQRFWKRTFSIFWMIEAGLFAFFVYMVLNASSEVWAAYDTPSLFKTQFFSLKMLFVRLSLISLTILFTSLLVNLAVRQDSHGELPLQFVITCLIVLSLWIESYQFYLFVICAPAYAWAFNAEVHEAFIEADVRRNRLIRNFVFVCAMAKFWHFLFIAVNWFFYMNRQLEQADVRSGLLNASIQNLLILYILNLIAMFPYVKHFIHKGLAKPYFWFLVDEGISIIPQALAFTYTLYTNLF